MRHILHAKVNVLIENNRLQSQKREKERQLKKKLNQKLSFSHYEEPSTKIAQHIQPALVLPSPPPRGTPYLYQHYATEDSDGIFHKRFNEVEKKIFGDRSIEQLRKEQYYLKKLFQNIKQKIDTAKSNDELALPKANDVKPLHKVASQPYLFHKENLDNHKYRIHKREKDERPTFGDSMATNESKATDNSPESSLNRSQISQLKAQYAHLEGELSRFIIMGVGDNIELSVAEMEKEISEINKIIAERKKEIADIKAAVSSKPKVVMKDIISNQKFEQYKKQISSLQADIFRRDTKNKEKKQYLTILQNNISRKKRQAQSTGNEMVLKLPQKEIEEPSTINTDQTTKATNKNDQQVKIKHKTTLQEANQNRIIPEQQIDWLIRKKQALAKSIKSQDKRWRQLYNDKMRKIVSGCSNIKEISNLTSQIQLEKEIKVEEISQLRYKNALTES